ncbi:hypothetical protein [Tessaracoccus sp. MC1756]|uniref:hypothetical protein n=1 Tax=Tessaracoccus sp. MC1756 TaxID=2760311 RepID=UPI0015FF1F18|nr:hypothetical protein [Tessaracoccus sp. MC1756]MBB1510173.1 hypothetical protein [Tessaracoccus sp. MC1756]
MNKIIAGVSAAAMAAGLGLGAATLANADTTEPTAPPSSSATDNAAPWQRGDGSAFNERGQGGHHLGGMMGRNLSGLAETLGVEESELSDAIVTAREAVRPAERPAMPDTQEERDALRSEHQAAFAEALADELGLDEATVADALEEAMDSGMTGMRGRGGPRR